MLICSGSCFVTSLVSPYVLNIVFVIDFFLCFTMSTADSLGPHYLELGEEIGMELGHPIKSVATLYARVGLERARLACQRARLVTFGLL